MTIGPSMVTASRFTDSPVGPFLQLTVAVPARMGSHVGWYVSLMVVDRQDARTGARLNWGFPAELGRLRWRCEDDDHRELVWDDRDIVVRAHGRGPRVPLAVPHRELQSRGDGPVVVPDHMYGLFRPAVVRVHAFPGDPLARLAGAHPGTMVGSANRVLSEARTSIGLIAPSRAVAPAPEPLRSEPVTCS